MLLGIDIPSRLPPNQSREPSRLIRGCLENINRSIGQYVRRPVDESTLSRTIELVISDFITLGFKNMHNGLGEVDALLQINEVDTRVVDPTGEGSYPSAEPARSGWAQDGTLSSLDILNVLKF